MTIETRLIHASSNGDRWLLVGNPEQGPVVRHEPNRSSGGLASDMSLDEFLQRDGQGPQHDALRFMLAHPIAEAAQDDVEFGHASSDPRRPCLARLVGRAPRQGGAGRAGRYRALRRRRRNARAGPLPAPCRRTGTRRRRDDRAKRSLDGRRGCSPRVAFGVRRAHDRIGWRGRQRQCTLDEAQSTA